VVNPRIIIFKGVENTAKNTWINGIPIRCDIVVENGTKENAVKPEKIKYFISGNC